jgi:hypothetical protein
MNELIGVAVPIGDPDLVYLEHGSHASLLRSSSRRLAIQGEGVMADNKSKRAGSDRGLIALSERYEVQYWSKKFKVTPAKLRYAVKKVGHSAKKVEDYIKLQKHRARDKNLIALSEPYEVHYWSKKFKVTPTRLKAAVKAAGRSAKNIGAYLADKKKTAKKTAAKRKAT